MNAITPNINYFAQYAEAASANQIEGKLLKFSKGDWTYGVDGLELPAGTRLVALMTTLTIGWQRWANGKPMDTRFGLVANGYQPPNRRELGDEDSAVWEVDANGDARDPWAFVNRFVLIRPDAQYSHSRRQAAAASMQSANFARRILAQFRANIPW